MTKKKQIPRSKVESNSMKTVAGAKVEKALEVALDKNLSVEQALKETKAELSSVEPKDLDKHIKEVLNKYNIHDQLKLAAVKAKFLQIMMESDDENTQIKAGSELTKTIEGEKDKTKGPTVYSENVNMLFQQIEEGRKKGE